MYRVAQAIISLEDLYGRIGRVTGKGPVVKQVWELVSKISLEPRKPNSKANRNYKTIDHLVLIDRSVDLMTPMATQLTFEGLIDELFGIDCCKFILNEKLHFHNCVIKFCVRYCRISSRQICF